MANLTRVLTKIRELSAERRKLIASVARAGGWDSAEQMITEFATIDTSSLRQLASTAQPIAKTAPAKPGKKARKARVTLDDADKAKLLAEIKGGLTQSAAAKKFGVSIGTVQNIRNAAKR